VNDAGKRKGTIRIIWSGTFETSYVTPDQIQLYKENKDSVLKDLKPGVLKRLKIPMELVEEPGAFDAAHQKFLESKKKKTKEPKKRKNDSSSEAEPQEKKRKTKEPTKKESKKDKNPVMFYRMKLQKYMDEDLGNSEVALKVSEMLNEVAEREISLDELIVRPLPIYINEFRKQSWAKSLSALWAKTSRMIPMEL
jgi:hypothetical protein